MVTIGPEVPRAHREGSTDLGNVHANPLLAARFFASTPRILPHSPQYTRALRAKQLKRLLLDAPQCGRYCTPFAEDQLALTA
jgi:hypothetical protein